LFVIKKKSKFCKIKTKFKETLDLFYFIYFFIIIIIIIILIESNERNSYQQWINVRLFDLIRIEKLLSSEYRDRDTLSTNSSYSFFRCKLNIIEDLVFQFKFLLCHWKLSFKEFYQIMNTFVVRLLIPNLTFFKQFPYFWTNGLIKFISL